MDFLKKFVNENIISIGGDKPQAPATPATPAVATKLNNISIPTMATATQATSYVAPAVSQEMVDHLNTKVVFERKSPYTSIVAAAQKIDPNDVPDEDKRLRIAYKMEGSTPSLVIQAIDVHIQDVEGERARFKEKIDKQISTAAGGLRKEAAVLDNQCQAHGQRIEQLQAEIQQLHQKIEADASKSAELKSKADAAEAEYVAKAEAFNMAAEYVKSNLSNQKQALSSLLS